MTFLHHLNQSYRDSIARSKLYAFEINSTPSDFIERKKERVKE
jgi:hypothetical protein